MIRPLLTRENRSQSRDCKGAVARAIALPALLAFFAALGLHAQSAGEIRGFAWDGDGKPIAGARVELSGAASQIVTAAPDGSFTFANLAAGHYRVTGSEEKREIVSEVSVPIDLTAGQTVHADVTVAKGIRHYPRWKRILRRLDGISQ